MTIHKNYSQYIAIKLPLVLQIVPLPLLEIPCETLTVTFSPETDTLGELAPPSPLPFVNETPVNNAMNIGFLSASSCDIVNILVLVPFPVFSYD